METPSKTITIIVLNGKIKIHRNYQLHYRTFNNTWSLFKLMKGLYNEQTALERNFAPNNLCANFVKTDPTVGLLSRFSLATLFSLLLSQRISFAYPLNLGLKWISFCPTVTQSIPIFSSTFVSINTMLYYVCWCFLTYFDVYSC